MKVDTSGLRHFQNQLIKIENGVLHKTIKKVAIGASQKAKRELISLYNSIDPLEITNNKIPTEKDIMIERFPEKILVTVYGDSVAFIEFGVGMEGKGTYDFRKAKVSWAYHIPTPRKRITKQHGIRGWFTPRAIQRDTYKAGYYVGAKGYSAGFPAQKPIFTTARKLERLIPSVTAKVLKEEFK